MAPPANDAFASAEVLSTTIPNEITGRTTRDATFEGSETNKTGATSEQSVWFKFTPTVTGRYRFRIPWESLVYNGVSVPSVSDLYMQVSSGSTLATFDANTVSTPAYNNTSIGTPTELQNSLGEYADLTSGTTYWIRVWSRNTGTANQRTLDFDLQWELLTEASNNDFANRITLSGGSGSQAFSIAQCDFEGSEPIPFYTWEGSESFLATCWFQWTCPSSGWYEFFAEYEVTAGFEELLLAIWTGSTLGSLTKVARVEGGVPGRKNGTKIRFNATSGTVYKIQLGAYNDSQAQVSEGTLSWATASAPTGDTTSAAPEGQFEDRVDNYGNTDDELPPNAVTYLDPHSRFTYNDGAVGRSKWWKFTAPSNGSITISAAALDDEKMAYGSYALLVYKGANFAGLTIATNTASANAVMVGAATFDSPEAETLGGLSSMTVNYTTGQIVWICLVGIYDKDVNNDTVDTADGADAPQVAIDLHFGTAPSAPPANNNIASVLHTSNIHDWDNDFELNKRPWGTGFVDTQAMKYVGTTVSATAEASEPAHGGYGPTRSTWHIFRAHFNPGSYKIWVESAVDCVLSVYNYDPSLAGIGSLVSIGEDDDSGAGNWPELTLALTPNAYYWIAVDSKTEGAYTLKVQKQSTGTPPANDNFASATAFTKPFVVGGSTVGGTGEPGEYASQYQFVGPTDGVWYKYTPTYTGTAKIRGKCISAYDDAYVFCHVFTGSAVDALTLVSTDSENGVGGEFFFGADPDKSSILSFPVTSGTDYYIRVASWSGGSEDFQIYVDTQQVYLDLQVSSVESGPNLNVATIYLDLQPSSTDVFSGTSLDSATVYLDLRITSVEVMGHEYIDSGTVYLNLTNLGGECFSTFSAQFLGDGEASLRFQEVTVELRFTGDAEKEWSDGELVVEGIAC